MSTIYINFSYSNDAIRQLNSCKRSLDLTLGKLKQAKSSARSAGNVESSVESYIDAIDREIRLVTEDKEKLTRFISAYKSFVNNAKQKDKSIGKTIENLGYDYRKRSGLKAQERKELLGIIGGCLIIVGCIAVAGVVTAPLVVAIAIGAAIWSNNRWSIRSRRR